MTDEDGRFRIEGAMPGVFRLTFSLGNVRYDSEKSWDLSVSTLISNGEAETELGDITVRSM